MYRTSVLEYDIETVPDIKPIRMKPYSCPYKHKEIKYKEIEKLKEADLIRPAKMSQWGFPTVLVNKPHSNKMRMCNDVRKLNDKDYSTTISYVKHELSTGRYWEKKM